MNTMTSAGTYEMAGNNQATDEKLRNERTKRLLLYFGMVGMVMLFAGLTSAVIVSKGGHFWVNIKLPVAFWYSSGLIVVSSLTAILAQRAIAKNKQGATKIMLLITLMLGIGFGVAQFVGYGQLVNHGFHLTSRVMTDEGEFIPKGEYGKDFTVSWKGQELRYEDGLFFLPDRPLNAVEKLELTRSRNTASSFLIVLSFLHLLHMVGGVLYLLAVNIMAFKGRFSSDNYMKIKLNNIYWHFLGILWIYLFVFLQYIH